MLSSFAINEIIVVYYSYVEFICKISKFRKNIYAKFLYHFDLFIAFTNII